MARRTNWRVGETRRKYRTINGKRRLCNVTKKRGGKYGVKVVNTKPQKHNTNQRKALKMTWEGTKLTNEQEYRISETVEHIIIDYADDQPKWVLELKATDSDSIDYYVGENAPYLLRQKAKEKAKEMLEQSYGEYLEYRNE